MIDHMDESIPGFNGNNISKNWWEKLARTRMLR